MSHKQFVDPIQRPPVAAASAALMAGFALAQLPSAMAEEAFVMEEIVVTAQRREESLQEVPISVVAMSQAALDNAGIRSTRELSAVVPSIQMAVSGPSAIFFVRGVGNTSAGTGEEGTNAFYVDGVFMPSLKQVAMKFNNIERIEVLKGPQGTLFGRNSSGGLVNIITREPGQEFTGNVKLGYDNYDTSLAQAYLAGPLTDTLAADIALTSSSQEKGWGENLATGDEIGRGWDWGARSKWVWTPSDKAKFTLAGEYAKSSDTYSLGFRLDQDSIGLLGTQPLDDPYDINTTSRPYINLQSYGVNLTADIDLDWATLTSITGHRHGENDSYFDTDLTPLDLFNIRVEDTEESYQQEFRLASNSSGRLNWQTGIFLLRLNADLDPQSHTGLALGGADYAVYSKLETTSYALFGEASYDITEKTILTLGGRYTRDKLDFEGRQALIANDFTLATADESVKENEPTYRLSLRQIINDNVNVYASYNRGYKAGTFSMSAITQAPVKPQTIDAFEVGVKSELFERRLRFNASLFHYEISDYQVRSAAGDNPVPTLLNAAAVDLDGLEVEFEAVPTNNLRLFGALSWLDSEFTDFPYAPITSLNPNFPFGASETLADASGNKTPLAPEFAGNLGVNYSLPLRDSSVIDLTVVYSYNDGYFFEPDNRLEQPSFELLNSSITYRAAEQWRVELWGRNLLDEEYYTQKLTVGPFADNAIPAAPRSYGVTIAFDF
ncbi:TonB-dependent receptor [Halioxenophilus sp. WMMB6]|uniref:TonB-dependent receptor n=1 Tax=Halioxenophilus sp. WMMB6 TaxID=3073815 RepID=UPI00295EAC6F|nr:TonB-dependent receptor [Halioxenophilus sp. WMMB6]